MHSRNSSRAGLSFTSLTGPAAQKRRHRPLRQIITTIAFLASCSVALLAVSTWSRLPASTTTADGPSSAKQAARLRSAADGWATTTPAPVQPRRTQPKDQASVPETLVDHQPSPQPRQEQQHERDEQLQPPVLQSPASTSAAAGDCAAVDDVLLAQYVTLCTAQQDTTVVLQKAAAAITAHSAAAPAAPAQQQHAPAHRTAVTLSEERLPRHLGVTGDAAAGDTAVSGMSGAAQRCPPVLLPLAAGDRSHGLCTDAGLYAQLLGAWLLPDTPAARRRAAGCGGRSVLLFLEPLYDAWLEAADAASPALAVVLAPNFEQLSVSDTAGVQRAQLVLCKVGRCTQLMRPFLAAINSSAVLLTTGHTSIDPRAILAAQRAAAAAVAPLQVPAALHSPPPPHRSGAPSHHHRKAGHAGEDAPQAASPQQQQQQQQQQDTIGAADAAEATSSSSPPSQGLHTGSALAAAASALNLTALHVRGKSGLKHTPQLLDCWLQHPDWPLLTVVGPMPNEQITLQKSQEYMAAANIHVPRPGRPAGPGWPSFDPLPAAQLAAAQTSSALHILPSEREGFGHAINEARAAGALLIVPDHPPMNELARNGSAVLIQPLRTFSHAGSPSPALARFGDISASVTPQGICDAVARALDLPPQQRAAMGAAARRLFEEDRAQFERRMRSVKGLMAQLAHGGVPAAAAAAAASGGGSDHLQEHHRGASTAAAAAAAAVTAAAAVVEAGEPPVAVGAQELHDLPQQQKQQPPPLPPKQQQQQQPPPLPPKQQQHAAQQLGRAA